MRRQLEQTGVETNRVVITLEHGAFQVVVEQGLRDSAEEAKRSDMSLQESAHALVVKEPDVQHARVAEHHHEGRKGPLATFDLPPPEASPIYLGLFSGKGAQLKKRLGRLARPHLGDQVSKVVLPARVASLPDHPVQHARRQPGVPLEDLLDKGPIGVDHR